MGKRPEQIREVISNKQTASSLSLARSPHGPDAKPQIHPPYRYNYQSMTPSSVFDYDMSTKASEAAEQEKNYKSERALPYRQWRQVRCPWSIVA
jgi:hypothetical protein